MSDSLFQLPEDSDESKGQEHQYPITKVQIAQIRAEFNRLHIASMDDRKKIVGNMSTRPINKLAEMTAVEARRLLLHLRNRSIVPLPSGGSAWDDRSEETWIDKL